MQPRRKAWFWVLATLVVLLLASLAWVGVRGWTAKSELEAAQALMGQLKSQAVAFDVDGATATLTKIEQHVDSAIRLTGDPVWRTFEYVPRAGQNLTVVRELASTTGDILRDTVEPLLGVAANLNPSSLAPQDGGIDLQPFVAAIPGVAKANAAAQAAVIAVAAIDDEGALSQLSAAKNRVQSLLDDVAPLLEGANSLLALVPPAMGSDGARTYVVMFQNNAELRALGGTALSFALLKVDQGKIDLAATVPAGMGNFAKYDTSVIPIPDGAEKIYPAGEFGTYIPNATIRPSFVTAAEITQQMWLRQFNYPVDGIISVDPVALSYLLKATDPIPLSSGDVLNSTSLVPLLLNQVYSRFNTGDAVADNRLEDIVYGEAVSATFSRLTNGPLDPKTLISSVTQAISERRILLWSARPEEQAALVANGMAGELPASTETVDRVGVYLQDVVGSKLNFYLQPAVTLAQATCRADGLQSYRVTVNLTSTVPADAASLSPSILGQWEREDLAPGVQRLVSLLYAPPGSTITGITIQGGSVDVVPLHDTDYPVAKITVLVPPGGTATIAYDIVSKDATAKTLEADVTPTVTTTPVTKEPLDCATAAAG